jgi:hypothetical protein
VGGQPGQFNARKITAQTHFAQHTEQQSILLRLETDFVQFHIRLYGNIGSHISVKGSKGCFSYNKNQKFEVF